MTKNLFFDDSRLFVKENVTRRYGKPTLAAKYHDPDVSTDYCTGWVFRLDDGKYRLLYFGHSVLFTGKKLFAAISDDGVNFKPEQLFDLASHPEKQFSHEIMSISHGEIAFVYEDKHTADASERYKLLFTASVSGELRMENTVYTSPDLINWTLIKTDRWSDGAEPLTSVFYNSRYGTHTVVERPFWGIRTVGYKETKDFRTYSEYRDCVSVDAFDDDLAEIYGMYAFEYDGNYIGLPHIYRGLHSELSAKYNNGIIDTQLAYSPDGRFWRRSLREPFLSGINGTTDSRYNLLWSFGHSRVPGEIRLYSSVSEHEHGPAFKNPGTGRILVFKLREDGFVSLVSKDPALTSAVATREKIWHGGELHLNLKAKRATVAVYSSSSEDVPFNVLAFSQELKGYSHEDCIPFSGDSTDWTPTFKNGKTLDELKGKTLIIELRFVDGELFSMSGDYTDVFNTEGAIYRQFGKLRT